MYFQYFVLFSQSFYDVTVYYLLWDMYIIFHLIKIECLNKRIFFFAEIEICWNIPSFFIKKFFRNCQLVFYSVSFFSSTLFAYIGFFWRSNSAWLLSVRQRNKTKRNMSPVWVMLNCSYKCTNLVKMFFILIILGLHCKWVEAI